MFLFSIFIFLIGLAVGSFLNTVIFRLKSHQPILFSRSRCPQCKKILAWYDLIPLISFILTFGKCRYCKKPISWQYPIVELITGILFVLGFIKILSTQKLTNVWPIFVFNLLYFWFIFSVLIIIFVYDLRFIIIPDKVIYPALVLTTLGNLVLDLLAKSSFTFPDSRFISGLFAGFLSFAFFLILVLVSRGRWMGQGDVKLSLFLGLILGWPHILVCLFLAFVLGALIGLLLVVLKKKSLKDQIPFGPFLTSSCLLTIFFGSALLSWYLSLLL